MNLLTIFVLVLIIVLIYAVYQIMTKSTTKVSGFSDASKSLSVPCSKFGANANFGYSTWIYIDSWQNTVTPPAAGSTAPILFKKNILSRVKGGTTALFNLYLDNAQNDLKLLINGTTTPCTIKNIKLQKWVNITISVYGNTVDMYLDGKLVRTCVLTAVPTALDTADTLYVGGGYQTQTSPTWSVLPDGGDLRGYISNVVYKSDYFTPEEAWTIYSAGYSGAGMFDFVNRYKLNFSIVKDDQTVGQVSI
jgi:hypothetical protein